MSFAPESWFVGIADDEAETDDVEDISHPNVPGSCHYHCGS